MKKFLCGLTALLLTLSLAACGGKTEAGHSGDDMSLAELRDSILDGVEDLPMLMDTEPDQESFEYFTFIPWEEGLSALVSEAAINAVPHSVVLIRAGDSKRAAELAKEVEANANPAKWICVEAEKTIVSVHGSTILLVMSSAKTADAIAANFDSLWK